MRLLICTGIFPPESGGPATYSQNLASELKARGHDVSVITYTDEKLVVQYPFPVVGITRSRFKIWHYFKYFLAARRLGKGVDVLYAQDPVSAGYPTFLAAKILKKPFVVKVTGDYSWEQAMGRGLTDKPIDEFQTWKPLPRSIARIRDIQIHVCKSADLVITPSEYLKKLVVGWGVKEKRIEVIYNAAPQIPMLKRDESRRALAVGADDFLVLSAGRPVRWKGFEALGAAVADLQVKNPNIKLRILSDAARATVLQYMKAADVFVLNTGYEGFSHVTVEAMAMGTPVIVSNVGGNPEIVNSGENGLLVDYNNAAQIQDAILEVYQHPELGEKFSKNGVETVKKFSVEAMINQTERALKSCAS